MDIYKRKTTKTKSAIKIYSTIFALISLIMFVAPIVNQRIYAREMAAVDVTDEYRPNITQRVIGGYDESNVKIDNVRQYEVIKHNLLEKLGSRQSITDKQYANWIFGETEEANQPSMQFADSGFLGTIEYMYWDEDGKIYAPKSVERLANAGNYSYTYIMLYEDPGAFCIGEGMPLPNATATGYNAFSEQIMNNSEGMNQTPIARALALFRDSITSGDSIDIDKLTPSEYGDGAFFDESNEMEILFSTQNTEEYNKTEIRKLLQSRGVKYTPVSPGSNRMKVDPDPENIELLKTVLSEVTNSRASVIRGNSVPASQVGNGNRLEQPQPGDGFYTDTGREVETAAKAQKIRDGQMADNEADLAYIGATYSLKDYKNGNQGYFERFAGEESNPGAFPGSLQTAVYQSRYNIGRRGVYSGSYKASGFVIYRASQDFQAYWNNLKQFPLNRPKFPQDGWQVLKKSINYHKHARISKSESTSDQTSLPKTIILENPRVKYEPRFLPGEGSTMEKSSMVKFDKQNQAWLIGPYKLDYVLATTNNIVDGDPSSPPRTTQGSENAKYFSGISKMELKGKYLADEKHQKITPGLSMGSDEEEGESVGEFMWNHGGKKVVSEYIDSLKRVSLYLGFKEVTEPYNIVNDVTIADMVDTDHSKDNVYSPFNRMLNKLIELRGRTGHPELHKNAKIAIELLNQIKRKIFRGDYRGYKVQGTEITQKEDQEYRSYLDETYFNKVFDNLKNSPGLTRQDIEEITQIENTSVRKTNMAFISKYEASLKGSINNTDTESIESIDIVYNGLRDNIKKMIELSNKPEGMIEKKVRLTWLMKDLQSTGFNEALKVIRVLDDQYFGITAEEINDKVDEAEEQNNQILGISSEANKSYIAPDPTIGTVDAENLKDEVASLTGAFAVDPGEIIYSDNINVSIDIPGIEEMQKNTSVIVSRDLYNGHVRLYSYIRVNGYLYRVRGVSDQLTGGQILVYADQNRINNATGGQTNVTGRIDWVPRTNVDVWGKWHKTFIKLKTATIINKDLKVGETRVTEVLADKKQYSSATDDNTNTDNNTDTNTTNNNSNNQNTNTDDDQELVEPDAGNQSTGTVDDPFGTISSDLEEGISDIKSWRITVARERNDNQYGPGMLQGDRSFGIPAPMEEFYYVVDYDPALSEIVKARVEFTYQLFAGLAQTYESYQLIHNNLQIESKPEINVDEYIHDSFEIEDGNYLVDNETTEANTDVSLKGTVQIRRQQPLETVTSAKWKEQIVLELKFKMSPKIPPTPKQPEPEDLLALKVKMPLVIPIGGRVWEDKHVNEQKHNLYDHIYTEGSNDTPVSGTKVTVFRNFVKIGTDGAVEDILKREYARLYEIVDGELKEYSTVDNIYTNDEGKWGPYLVHDIGFNQEELNVIGDGDNSGYAITFDVRYDYDGLYYEPVLPMHTDEPLNDTEMLDRVAMWNQNKGELDKNVFANSSLVYENTKIRDEFNTLNATMVGKSAVDKAASNTTLGKTVPLKDHDNPYANLDGREITYETTQEDVNRIISTYKKVNYKDFEEYTSPDFPDDVGPTTDAQKDSLKRETMSTFMNASSIDLGLRLPSEDKIVFDTEEQAIKPEFNSFGGMYSATFDYMQRINLGLKRREIVDIGLTKDLVSGLLTVNKKAYTYNYDALQEKYISDEELAENLGPGARRVWNLGKMLDRDAQKDHQEILDIYKTDYIYRTSMYNETPELGDALKEETDFEKQKDPGVTSTGETKDPRALDIFITYLITVENRSAADSVLLSGIDDYHSEKIETVQTEVTKYHEVDPRANIERAQGEDGIHLERKEVNVSRPKGIISNMTDDNGDAKPPAREVALLDPTANNDMFEVKSYGMEADTKNYKFKQETVVPDFLEWERLSSYELNPESIKLNPAERVEIYTTYRVKDIEEIRDIVNGEETEALGELHNNPGITKLSNALRLGSMYNIAEVAQFTTYDALTGKASAKYDECSAPDNINFDYVEFDEAQTGDIKVNKIESDTDYTIGIRLEINKEQDEVRERNLKGVVFEDKRNSWNNGIATGDGKKEADEQGIPNMPVTLEERVSVQRVNTAVNGNQNLLWNHAEAGQPVEYVDIPFIWPRLIKQQDIELELEKVTGFRANITTDGDGNYDFKGVPAGNFVVALDYTSPSADKKQLIYEQPEAKGKNAVNIMNKLDTLPETVTDTIGGQSTNAQSETTPDPNASGGTTTDPNAQSGTTQGGTTQAGTTQGGTTNIHMEMSDLVPTIDEASRKVKFYNGIDFKNTMFYSEGGNADINRRGDAVDPFNLDITWLEKDKDDSKYEGNSYLRDDPVRRVEVTENFETFKNENVSAVDIFRGRREKILDENLIDKLNQAHNMSTMRATTPKINFSVQYYEKNADDKSRDRIKILEEYKDLYAIDGNYVTENYNNKDPMYEVTGINLGLVERPQTKVVMDKEITNIVVSTSDGEEKINIKYDVDVDITEEPAIDADSVGYGQSVNPMKQATFKRKLKEEESVGADFVMQLDRTELVDNQLDANTDINSLNSGFRYINIDESLMQDATINIEYGIFGVNLSEIDNDVKTDDPELDSEEKKLIYREKAFRQGKFYDSSMLSLLNHSLNIPQGANIDHDNGYGFDRFVGREYYIKVNPNAKTELPKDDISDVEIKEVIDIVDNNSTVDLADPVNDEWVAADKSGLIGLIQNVNEDNYQDAEYVDKDGEKYIVDISNPQGGTTTTTNAVATASGTPTTPPAGTGTGTGTTPAPTPAPSTPLGDSNVRSNIFKLKGYKTTIQTAELATDMASGTPVQYPTTITEDGASVDEYVTKWRIRTDRTISPQADVNSLEFENIMELVGYTSSNGVRDDKPIGDLIPKLDHSNETGTGLFPGRDETTLPGGGQTIPVEQIYNVDPPQATEIENVSDISKVTYATTATSRGSSSSEKVTLSPPTGLGLGKKANMLAGISIVILTGVIMAIYGVNLNNALNKKINKK